MACSPEALDHVNSYVTRNYLKSLKWLRSLSYGGGICATWHPKRPHLTALVIWVRRFHKILDLSNILQPGGYSRAVGLGMVAPASQADTEHRTVEHGSP